MKSVWERLSRSWEGESSVTVGATAVTTVAVGWYLFQRLSTSDDKDHENDNDTPMIPRHERFSIRYADRSRTQSPEHPLGPRGQKALAPPLPYLGAFLTCLGDQCHPDTNPKGHIALCVAENKLVLDLMAERFMQSGSTGFSDSTVFTYNSMLGMPVAREAAAYFLARRFLWPPHSHPEPIAPQVALQEIKPKYIGFGAGCAALINHIFFLLGNAQTRDCCLIPKPYYAAFENDMNLIAGILPFGVDQANPAAGPTPEEWQTAFDQARAKGMNPKFVLITNPNNPLGTIYEPSMIRATIDWARSQTKHSMHIVMDEIYALSTHNPHALDKFQSVLKILNNDLGQDVHLLWAVSKDFGGSGLRCGLIYTQNELVMEGLATLSIFTAVSGPIQYLVAELLTDDVFVDFFLNESRKRIRTSYEICIGKLNEMVMPFIPADAGLFVYVDFSSLLPEKTFAWEEELSQFMFEQARVVLTPGQSQRDVNPGMFRICYAWVSPEVLEIAMERLSRLVSKIRRLDLEDWKQIKEGRDSNKLGTGNDEEHLARAFAGILD